MKRQKAVRGTFSRRLQTQLMAVFAITITILISVVSTFSYRRAEIVIQEQSGSLMQQRFLQNRYSIETFTREAENVLRLLMTQASMQEYMRRGYEESYQSVALRREVFDYTNGMMRNYEYIDSVYFYGSDGTVLGVRKTENQVDERKRMDLPWYALEYAHDAGNYLGEIRWMGGYTDHDFSIREMKSDEGTIPYISAVCPVYLITGRFVSVVINISQREFVNFFSQVDGEDGMESYLTDDDGIIISHKDPEMLGERTEFRPTELEEQESGYLMKEQIQVNYLSLPEYSWWLVSEIPEKELYGSLEILKLWFVLLAAGGLAVGLALYSYSLHRLTAPLKSLRGAMERMEQGALGEQLDESSRNELGLLGRQFNRMSQSIDTMVTRIRDMEQEKSILEKEALKAQMNPHFLFNTLSNMRFMARLDQKEALEECFEALGRMLQPIYRSEGDLWSLGEELTYLSDYLVIMNVRFGGRVEMEIEIPEYLKEFRVLKFILQPLVENAIEHGFVRSGGEGLILLGAEERKELKVYVEDNGNGMEPEQQRRLKELLLQASRQRELYRDHVGVVNVHRRLQAHFGPDYGIRFESVPGEFTCFYLTMPVITEDGNGTKYRKSK